MRRDRLLLTIVGAALGIAVLGLATAAAGAALGFVSASSRRLAAVTAVSLLVATALFAVTEQTLDLGTFGQFVDTRPSANVTARLVSVAWMIAVVVGWTGTRTAAGDVDNDKSSLVQSSTPGTRASVGVAAIVGTVAAIGTLALVGDHTWSWASIPMLLGSIVLLVAFDSPRILHSELTTVIRTIPSRALSWGTERNDEIVKGSLWMLGGTAVVSLGSFVFWIAATRVAPQESVGVAAALFSVVTFLNYATSLGLPIALSRFARDTTLTSSVLFTWSLVLTLLSSVVGVAIFALFAPGTIVDAIGSLTGWAILALSVAGMSLSVLVDVRCMTLRIWPWFFWRTVAIFVVRIPFLVLVPETDPALFLFLVVAGAYGFTGLIWLGALLVRTKERIRVRPAPEQTPDIVRYAIVNYFGQLAMQGPFFVVPLIVLSSLSAEANASFYLAWGIMSVVVISVQMTGQVLLVEGSQGTNAAGQATATLVVGLAISVFSLVAVSVLGSVIHAIYGNAYSDVPSLLVILIAGTVPYTVTVVGLNMARLESNQRATIVIALTFTAFVLVPTLVFTDGHGAIGAAWGWLLGNCGAAVVVIAMYKIEIIESLQRLRLGRAVREDSPSTATPSGSDDPVPGQ